jgi:hypothetical protein
LKTDDSSGNKLETSGKSFKPPFCLIEIEQKRKMSTTTRQERERAVIDLYHNQRKTVREIAKEARMSFRDIGAVLNKADEAQQRKGQEQDNQQLSLATQAYKLFSQGKNPMEVAVALNVRESEVTKFYKEYLKLNQMHDLNIEN